MATSIRRSSSRPARRIGQTHRQAPRVQGAQPRTTSLRGTKASTTRSRTRRAAAAAGTRRTSTARSRSKIASSRRRSARSTGASTMTNSANATGTGARTRSRRSGSGTARKYGAKAQPKAAKEMRPMKRRRAATNKKTRPIAIGLSKARRAGVRVPARKKAA